MDIDLERKVCACITRIFKVCAYLFYIFKKERRIFMLTKAYVNEILLIQKVKSEKAKFTLNQCIFKTKIRFLNMPFLIFKKIKEDFIMWPYSEKQEEKFAKLFEDVKEEPYSCFFNTLYRHGYIHIGRDHLQKYVSILKKYAMPFSVEQEDSFWYVLKIVKE